MALTEEIPTRLVPIFDYRSGQRALELCLSSLIKMLLKLLCHIVGVIGDPSLTNIFTALK